MKYSKRQEKILQEKKERRRLYHHPLDYRPIVSPRLPVLPASDASLSFNLRSFASKCAALDEIDRPINTGDCLLPERHSSCHATLPATLARPRLPSDATIELPITFFFCRRFHAEKSTRRGDIIPFDRGFKEQGTSGRRPLPRRT